MTQPEQSNESLAESIAEIAGSGVNVSEQDDIDKIMNEIEELQGDMRGTIAGPPASDASGATALEELGGESLPEPTSEGDPAWLEEAYGEKGAAKVLTAAADAAALGALASTPTIGSKKEQKPAPTSEASPEVSDVLQFKRSTPGLRSVEEETPAAREAAFKKADSSGTESGVTMNVQGNITVKLRHDVTGQEIGIRFVGNQHIVIAMENGTEIRIPAKSSAVARRPNLKVVA